MSWEALDTTWEDICAGRLCGLCQAPLPKPEASGFHYCAACVPATAARPHTVHVSIDHHTTGWLVCLSCSTPEELTYWMVNQTDEQIGHLVERLPISPHCRQLHPRSMAAWGRSGFYAHMTAAHYRNLRNAWQADPRNGHQKMLGAAARTTPGLSY